MTYKGRFTKTGNSSAYDTEPVIGDDPVLGAFLAFIEHDMVENPPTIRPLSEDLLARAGRLVGDMDVDLNERID